MSKQIWSINCNGNFDTWIDVECYDDVVVVMICGAGCSIGEENTKLYLTLYTIRVDIDERISMYSNDISSIILNSQISGQQFKKYFP